MTVGVAIRLLEQLGRVGALRRQPYPALEVTHKVTGIDVGLEADTAAKLLLAQRLVLVQDLGELLVAGVVDKVRRADRARDDEALLAVARLQDRGRALVQAVDVEQLVVDRQADAVEQAEDLVALRLGDVAAAEQSA